MALILVKNSGIDELWSAGYNGKGALGSGENVQTKSVFSRVAYDANAIKFVEIDIYQDHAAAITDDGYLYQWGFNGFGRCGIRDRDKNMFPQQFWEPKKVEYFNEYIVKQTSVGQGHTVIIAALRTNPTQNRVYAYGRDD
jgi:alpha-tubulin suppressor-like RCC1 family protein